MAPVARGIPNGKEYRLIFVACPKKRFFAPWIPIDGIIGMLQEIRRGFMNEAVRRPHR